MKIWLKAKEGRVKRPICTLLELAARLLSLDVVANECHALRLPSKLQNVFLTYAFLFKIFSKLGYILTASDDMTVLHK